MPWLKLFLPFAFGYFISYLYRTANAIIGPVLAQDLSLSDNALGLLTSTYFLAFGLAQLPLGILLDRYGPRRVEAGLLLFAAAGSALYAQADGLTQLAIGRGLVGLGVSACLMASFKAFSLWFPPERQASLTGWIMASGGLGALAAATPMEMALQLTSWRNVTMGLAIVTLGVSALLMLLVPDQPKSASSGIHFRDQLRSIADIYRHPHFRRYAPLAFASTGGFLAIQGLWASRWMNVMEGLQRAASAERLTIMNLGMLAGFLFMGFFATALVRRGVNLAKVYQYSMLSALLALAGIIVWPGSGGLMWPLLGICFSLSNLAYGLVGQAFPVSHSGRANTALNLLVFAGAFGLQWGIGACTDLLQYLHWSAANAYQATFGMLLTLQIAAFLWLFKGSPTPLNPNSR
ncbi:MAG: hypothetical protein RIR00_401 [Pseudomonadota bacterium]|jgi:MFS family permease